MPSVAARGHAGDPAADRLELRLAATPEAEEHGRRVLAARDLAPDRRAVRRAEDAIRDARPSLDRTDSLDVDTDFAGVAQRDQQQLLAMSDAESQA